MLIDPTTRYLAMNVADGFRKRTSAIRHAHAAIITRKTRKQAQEIVVTTTIGANIVNLATTAVVTDISNDTVNDTVTTAIAAKIVAKVDAAFTSSAATDTASTDDIATNIVATANTAVSSLHPSAADTTMDGLSTCQASMTKFSFRLSAARTPAKIYALRADFFEEVDRDGYNSGRFSKAFYARLFEAAGPKLRSLLTTRVTEIWKREADRWAY
ncbi:hypothetical protein GGI26_006513 [Coemansia sp. RSA 1358]|uniref:Uncharacterized protein n=1 Tax=Coemansia umbellata TaxID=1424467 RepID=A0ABQ8PCN1_9FUNG|nr:hypothetical protein EDC05_006490 [Coemansia umbellata]KAJ2618538.1 hypothetical protein GGI26_006513 [Coemansia sp. RSA 1358]